MLSGIIVLALAVAPAGEPAALPAPVDGSPGWQALRWGMTVDEVLAAVPGSARLEPPVKLADRSAIEAGLERVEVAATTFRVRFIFEGPGLALVSLRTAQDRYADGAAFDAVARHLEARWGAPAEVTRDAELVELRQTRWQLGRSTVDLKYIPGVVVILYHPAPAKEPKPARGG
jgi:hypothetical protein